MKKHRSALLLLLAIVVVAGCSESRPPVSGRVTLDGQPLAGTRVVFQPTGGGKLNPGIGAGGITDVDGRYTLTAVDGSGPGAVVGVNRITINKTGVAPKPDEDAPEIVPEKYNSKSELQAEIYADQTDPVNFDLVTK